MKIVKEIRFDHSGLHSTGSWKGVACSCGYCNGPLVVVRNGKIFDQLIDCQLVKQELYCVELA